MARRWAETNWYLRVVLDARWCMRGGPERYQARQRARLARMVAFARERSPFYRARYRELPPDVPFEALPPVTKPELMAAFDEWVTDPAASREVVEAHVADPGRIGQRLLGRHYVWATSGSSGVPARLVHEARAVAVYRGLTLARGWLPWLSPGRALSRLRRRDRTAVVVPAGTHLVSAGLAAVGRRQRPWPFNQVQVFPLGSPLPELVRGLNEFDPAEVVSYPTGLDLLADERAAGRLAIRPALVACGAEHLTAMVRQKVEAAFGCPLRENYGASEFPRFAWSCRLGRLHVSADWLVLEAVDEQYRPVPPGERSFTTLLTNLANRAQPIVRYDLGDRIVLPAERCGCGNPLPVVEVEGRQNETLRLAASDGGLVPLLPHPLLKVVETTPGVRRFQIVQRGPRRLAVRLEPWREAERTEVWAAVEARLQGYLSGHGVAGVEIRLSEAAPGRDPVSGKYRQVWVEGNGRGEGKADGSVG